MTSYLSDDELETTAGDLAETLNTEGPEDMDGVIDELAVALVEMDDLSGDDPVKYGAMQKVAGVLKYLEDDGDGEIHIETDGLAINIQKIPR